MSVSCADLLVGEPRQVLEVDAPLLDVQRKVAQVGDLRV